MIEGIVSIIAGAPKKFRRDDDAIDRFHHRYTTILLVVFAVVSTTHQLVGQPIHCWAPKEFEGSWIKYTNQYCWVKNTYWLPFEQEIPHEHETWIREENEVVYYQWIPFIFLGMAIFFYMPSVVWTSFNSKAGVDSDNILETAENFAHSEKLESKEKKLRLITNQIHRFVGSSPHVAGMTVKKGSAVSKFFCCFCGKKFGNYLVILYIITKILYIVNVFSQLFVLNSVLQTEFHIYGIEFVTGALEDRAFLNHTIFPKVTMCDFNVRALGNVRRYTVQCLLPINLYTEKMFVFLWFWMVLVLLLTLWNLLTWILKSALPKDRYGFIENSLIVMDRVEKGNRPDQSLCFKFVNEFLRLDGVFVLRLIASNTNKITSSEIIAAVWDKWRDDRMAKSGIPNEPEISNVDTMPMKPKPPPKPYYRPNAGPPPPPTKGSPPPPFGAASNFPSSPEPTAPYNEYA